MSENLIPETSTKEIISIRLEYGGQMVLTSNQLAELYGCKPYNLTNNFNAHKDEFIEGKDYYLIAGEDLKRLKKQLRRRLLEGNYPESNCKSNCPESNYIERIIPTYTSKAYLWAKTGAFKQSKFLSTDRADFYYAGLALSYFTSKVETPPPENSLFDEEVTNGKINLSAQSKLDILLKCLDATTDTDLKNSIAKEIFAIIAI